MGHAQEPGLAALPRRGPTGRKLEAGVRGTFGAGASTIDSARADAAAPCELQL